MKIQTWQNPGQLFVAQELINKVNYSVAELRIRKLLHKHMLGMLSPEEAQIFEQWKSQDKRNEDLARKVHEFSFIKKAITDPMEPKVEKSWQQLRHRMGYRIAPRRPWLYAAVAAVACICIWIASAHYLKEEEQPTLLKAGVEKALIYLADGQQIEMNDHLRYEIIMEQERENQPLPDISPNLFHTVQTPRGGEYSLTLNDGSHIHLNAESSLTVPADFSPENRIVNLSGEAYFDVASDKEHPFRVQTRRAKIKVLGTRFGVKIYSEDSLLHVTLEEGCVEINSAYEKSVLQAGEQAIVYPDGQIHQREVETYLYCGWNEKRIVYDNAPLIDILNDLGRWYNFETAYANDKLRQLRFSMDIDKNVDFNEVIELLEVIGRINIQVNNNKVMVREEN